VSIRVTTRLEMWLRARCAWVEVAARSPTSVALSSSTRGELYAAFDDTRDGRPIPLAQPSDTDPGDAGEANGRPPFERHEEADAPIHPPVHIANIPFLLATRTLPNAKRLSSAHEIPLPTRSRTPTIVSLTSSIA
jgi:hypothetical protein